MRSRNDEQKEQTSSRCPSDWLRAELLASQIGWPYLQARHVVLILESRCYVASLSVVFTVSWLPIRTNSRLSECVLYNLLSNWKLTSEAPMENLKEVPAPTKKTTMTTVAQAQSGPFIEPVTRLLVYGPAEWETFIEEWVSHCLKPQYKKVLRFSGANDKGIDVAGFEDDQLLHGDWVNYQCKHYGHPIAPGEAWPEIGKILWYSFKGDYRAPRLYFFVAPRGTGTTLTQLLSNPSKLKSELIDVWDKSVRDNITKKASIELSGDFLSYAKSFDFSIFRPISVREIVEQHRASPYFLARFGGGLPARPTPCSPPLEIEAHESIYIGKLLAAYADHTKVSVGDVSALKRWEKLDKHLHRQREAFFHAESLRVFVRDKTEPGTFESLQDEIFHGVVDACEADHDDGYVRVVAVTTAAQNMELAAHPLAPSAFTKDRHGICHQLANQDRLQWIK